MTCYLSPFLGPRERFWLAVQHDFEVRSFINRKRCFFLADVHFNDSVPKIDFKGIGLPLLRYLWCEAQGSILDAHSAKAFHNTHPSTRHGSDVQPFFHLFIVVVQI